MLTAKGARWGDLEVLDEEDILKNVKKVVFSFTFVTLPDVTVRPILCQPVQVQAQERQRKEKAPGICLHCSYTVHSNPPDHFSEQDKLHCCAYCNVTGGKRHGEHCKRAR